MDPEFLAPARQVPLRAALLCGLAASVLLLPAAASRGEAHLPLFPHPHLRGVPAAPCDHRFEAADVSPTGTGALEDWLNDPGRGDQNGDGALVFCLAPGVDYRPDVAGVYPQVSLTRDCSAAMPCVLRPDWSAPEHPYRQAPGERVILPSLALSGSAEAKLSHWHLQGLVVRPLTHPRRTWLRVRWTDDSVFDLLWLDFAAFDTSAGSGTINGLVLDADSDRNAVQRNLFTDCPDVGTDTGAIVFHAHYEPGLDSEGNLVADNEVRVCKAVVLAAGGVSLAQDLGGFQASGEDCVDSSTAPTQALASWATRTRIENNEAYLTPDTYFDCALGPGFAPTGGPETECACEMEGPFESKHRPPAGHENFMRFNRAWGSRPSKEGQWQCGGSGSNGGAFQSGNACEGSTVYTGNLAWDVPLGIGLAGDDMVAANNLVIDPIEGGGGGEPNGVALATLAVGNGLGAYRNVFVRPRNSFSPRGSDMDVRCNAVLEPLNENGPGLRGANVTTQSNFFYDDGTNDRLTYNLTDCLDGADGDGCPEEPGDHIFDSLGAAQMDRLCIETRRWTGPEWVCFESAWTTAASPHSGSQPLCDPGALGWLRAASLGVDLESETIPPADLVACAPGAGGETICDYDGTAPLRSLPGFVPEPASWLLQVAGLAAAGLAAARTRSRTHRFR